MTNERGKHLLERLALVEAKNGLDEVHNRRVSALYWAMRSTFGCGDAGRAECLRLAAEGAPMPRDFVLQAVAAVP